ncbi:hypothetical protein SAMN02799622_00821 [Methylobacterium sp. UNC378MF]|nr:hypothetical protein SAMN02799622_00821 [Methylobacterium sp. UNC378MF]
MHSEPVPALDVSAPAEIRVILPEPPSDVAACLKRSFPEIPDRALSTADVVRIIGRAKIQDRAKTACGLRALAWIEAVHRDFAKP